MLTWCHDLPEWDLVLLQLSGDIVEDEPVPVVTVLAKRVFTDQVAQDFQQEGQVKADLAGL